MGFLGVGVEGVDGVGDILPILLAEVAAVELKVTTAPGVDEGGGGFLGPAILADGEGAGVGGRRRQGIGEVRHRKKGIGELGFE